VRPYRWTILAVATAAQTAAAMLFQGLPAIGPYLRSDYGLTLGETGVAMSSVVVGMTLTLLGWGALADRHGERPVIASGLVGAALALGAAALTSEFSGLVTCLFVAGLFVASANAASGRAVMGWFAAEQRGLALGIRQASMPIGAAVAGLSLPLLAAGGTGRSLVALGAILLGAAVATGALLREPEHGAEEDAGRPAPLRDRRIWRLAQAGALLVAVQFAFLGFLVLYLHDERGLSAPGAAALLAAVQLVGAGVRVGLGRLSDSRAERVGPLRSVCLVLAAGAALTAAATHLPASVALPATLACAVVAVSWNGLVFTAAAELAGGARSGTALGFQNTVMSVVSGATLAGFGWLVSASSWTFGFALLALPALAARALLARVPEPARV